MAKDNSTTASSRRSPSHTGPAQGPAAEAPRSPAQPAGASANAGANRLPIYRFAPSPNGPLHLGHALSALITFEEARNAGGRFLLRIEDIDTGRARPAFVEGIYRDLDWLGIEWEEPVLHQSARFDAYARAARKLQEMQLLYRCFATRAQIAAAADPRQTDPDGAPLYRGLHKLLSKADIASRKAAGAPFALRIDMAGALKLAAEKLGGEPLTFTERAADGSSQSIVAEPARWGDAVILRKDVPASYHLAVVVDDAHQKVTHVTRGLDLLKATDIHRLLQLLLDLPTPLYRHHRLITDGAGRKLSKSAKDASLKDLREAGVTAAQVRKMLGCGEPAGC